MISRKLNKKWTTIAKYLFAVLATGLAYQTSNNIGYLVVGILELIVIAICSDMLLKKYKRIGYWGNSIALLLYTLQMFVVFFGNSFIQIVMLTNLDLSLIHIYRHSSGHAGCSQLY